MISLFKAAIILYLLVCSTASGQDYPEFAIPPLDSEAENIISDSSAPASLLEPDRQDGSVGLTPVSAFLASRDEEISVFDDDELSASISNLRSESGQVRSDGSTSSQTVVGFSDNTDSALFFSFDISDIPEDAQINDVDLELEELDMVGSPFSSLGCLNIYPASYGSLRSLSYSRRSAVTPYARICNANRLNSPVSSSSLRRALSSSLGEDRFQLRLQFEREMRSELVPPKDSPEPKQPQGDNQPDAPSENGPVDFRDVILGDISDLSPFLSQPQTPEMVIRSIESDRSLLQDDFAEYKDVIRKALNPGKVRIAQTQDAPSVQETNICYVDGKIGVWRFDGDDVPYCDTTYPLSCPEGQMLDSDTGSCCQDANENEFCDYKESHLVYIGAAHLIISYSMPVPVPEPPAIPPPVPSPPIEGAPDLGVIIFKPPRPSSLIDASSAGWGEVPANQVLVAMDSSMSFQEAREEARRLASDLGGSVVGEFEYLNLFQIETESRTLSDLRGDINFARGYESADLAFPNLQLYREISPAGMIYPGESGRGYQVIGVEEAWNAIYNESINLFEVRVGIIDDGLYTGRGQFNGTDIDTSIELYPGAPPNLLSLPKHEVTGSHGTGIASILTANSTSGLVGIAFMPLSLEGNLLVYMINVFDITDRSFFTSSLLGFKEEIERGSTILSCSLGYTGDPVGTVETAVLYEEFFKKLSVDHPRILFIFSAGNDGLAIDGDERIPNGRAGYLPNVITVGNIFNNGTLVPSSNRNKNNQYVTLAAPGEEAVWGIYDNGSLWNLGGGTSMAAPQVAAAAALIRSINPLLDAGEIKDMLKNTAHYDIEGNPIPREVGGLALNIDRAVKKAIHERPPQIEFLPDEPDNIEIPEDGGDGIILARPDASSLPAGYARVTISSATSKGYSVIVDGSIVGKDGIDGDAFDGIYTFLVTGDQRHTIRAASQFNQGEWPEEFYSAGSTYVYAF